jgi:hypothetical protein
MGPEISLRSSGIFTEDFNAISNLSKSIPGGK